MTLDDINSRIAPQLPTVVLSADTFEQDPTLTPLLQQYFSAEGGKITIAGVTPQNYSVDSATGVIKFSGVGQGGPFDGVPLDQVVITLAAGVPQLSIDGHPADGWTLTSGFPALTAPIVRELPFSAVTLAWGSVEDDDNTLGFYFAGNVDFGASPLNLLAPFTQGITVPQLWGTIQMQGSTSNGVVQYVPATVLVLDESANDAKLGPFTLYGPEITIFANPFFNTATKNWQTDTFVRIGTTVEFQSSTFKFSADIRDIRQDITFEADLDQPLGAALSDLSSFVGGTALGVPGFTLQFPQSLSLQDVRLVFAPAGPQAVKLIALDIGTDPQEQWQIWDNYYLQQIAITFHLTPGDSGYVVDGEISGLLGRKGDASPWLSLRAGFASDGHYTFYGGLVAPVSLSDAYTFFTGATNADLPPVTVESLFLSVDRPAGGAGVSFSAELSVDGDWPITQEPVEIDADSLLVKFDRQAGGATTATVSAVLTLATYSVGLEADYDSTSGWSFTGDVAAGSDPITLIQVADEIDTKFGIDTSSAPPVPSFVTAWSLEKLHADFTTAQKNFDFVLSVGNAAVPALELDFGVHLDHSDSAFTKSFFGTANLTAATWDAVITLTISQSTTTATPPSTTTTFSGVYSSDKPPKLSDLLAWVAQTANVNANLPAELNLDAEADGFAIQVAQKDQDPPSVEAAGEFSMQVEGSDWTLYFAYTNDTSFTPGGARALVNGQPAYVVGVALGGLFDLSKLPLVGRIPGVDALRIDKLGFFYTNAAVSTASPKLYFTVPAVGDPGKLAPDPTAAFLVQPGFSLMAVFGKQSDSGSSVASDGTMPLPVSTGPTTAGQAPAYNDKAAAPTDPIHWLDLNKTFGPVSLQKVGLGYDKPDTPATQLGRVSVYVDGAFKIAGFGMALDRLGISVDIPNPKGGVTFNFEDDVSFHLGGLFVNYQAPGFQIGGGFITLPGGSVNFIGEFTVLAGEFGLQAYGGFSNQAAAPSLFLFLHINAPIGGPPFFFVNGLAGGFGVNRGFNLPTFDQLTNYPFLPASSTIPTPAQIGGDPSAQLATMMQALTSLAEYVPVEPGEYWLAIGLDVSSFEMIEVSAVLSVAFGVEFQVGVVGSASMTLPVSEPEPIAYIQIDFEVVFSPATGLVAAFGKITPASFIYGGMVHLSGGFAFYTWFSGPNAGNYVMTVGGYNARYSKPAIYPDVPRLQAVFGINSLNVTGDAYFALVPHAFMAGLQVHATWSMGSLDAWFDMGIDFLLNWKPFHYDADAYIQIGISLSIDLLFATVRITVHAGVSVEIWGPPFGGVAVVDLDIVSFTIRFGDQPVQESVDWKGFSAFLGSVDSDPHQTARVALAAAAPADDGNKPLVNVVVSAGLLKAFKPGESLEGLDWLIDPNGFALATTSTAPCTDGSFNGTSLAALTAAEYVDPTDLRGTVATAIASGAKPPFFAYKPAAGDPAWQTLTFGIPPMNLKDIQSTHTVILQKLDETAGPVDVTDVIAVLVTSSVSQALWGNAGVSADSLAGGHELVHGALTGVSILPMVWFPRRTTFIPYYNLVFDTNDLFLEQDAMPAINDAPYADPGGIAARMDSGALFSATAGARAGVVALLQQAGLTTISLAGDAGLNTGQYAADPMLGYLSHTDETKLAA